MVYELFLPTGGGQSHIHWTKSPHHTGGLIGGGHSCFGFAEIEQETQKQPSCF